MKNKQGTGKIAAAAIIMTICAFLPVISLKIGDTINNYKVYIGEIKTLRFSENVSAEDAFYLLRNGVWENGLEEDANIKYNELADIIRMNLLPYSNVGLIISYPEDYYITESSIFFVQSRTEPEFSSYIWRVKLESWEKTNQKIELYMDDKTGRILEITYKAETAVYGADYLTDKMNALTEVYTSSLNLGFEVDSAAYSDENMYTKIYYRLESEETDYGKMVLKTVVATYGFGVKIYAYPEYN